MSQTRERVRRLVESEVGECCAGDVDERLDELERLGSQDGALTRDTATFKSLGNETRLRLVRLLDAADRPLCVCELEAMINVSKSGVSHALSDLAEAGLVTREKRGKWRYYEPTDLASALLSTVDAHEAVGTGEGAR